MDGLIKSPNVDQTIGDLQDSGEANGGQLLNGGKPCPKAEINQSQPEEGSEVRLATRGGIWSQAGYRKGIELQTNDQ